jgi:hypothetical protein
MTRIRPISVLASGILTKTYLKLIIMKIKNYSLFAAIICTLFFSCSKKETTITTTPPIPVSNPIAPGNISGFVRGTLTTGNTYTITGDLTIKLGDTLASQEGVTVVVKNNSQIN